MGTQSPRVPVPNFEHQRYPFFSFHPVNFDEISQGKRILEKISEGEILMYNSPSNSLCNQFHFKSYSPKYHRSRRQFLEERTPEPHFGLERFPLFSFIWSNLKKSLKGDLT